MRDIDLPSWMECWPEDCPDRAKHRRPAGPNEDVGICRKCYTGTFEMRPENETFGLHWPDCSLLVRHEGECKPGGCGHPPAEIIRG